MNGAEAIVIPPPSVVRPKVPGVSAERLARWQEESPVQLDRFGRQIRRPTRTLHEAMELNHVEEWALHGASKVGLIHSLQVPPEAVVRYLWIGGFCLDWETLAQTWELIARIRFLLNSNVVGELPIEHGSYIIGAKRCTTSFHHGGYTAGHQSPIKLHVTHPTLPFIDTYLHNLTLEVTCDRIEYVADKLAVYDWISEEIVTGLKVISEYPSP